MPDYPKWRNRPGSDRHRTDYDYYGNGQLWKVIQAADEEEGPRAVTEYEYTDYGFVETITDPDGHATEFAYDLLCRRVLTTFPDDSTEVIRYDWGVGASPGRVGFTKDRKGVVTSLERDALGRVAKRIVGSHTADDAGENLTAVTDVNQQHITETTFGDASGLVITKIQNGKKVQHQYDYRHRAIATKRWPNGTDMQIEETVYLNNRVYYSLDVYGRREYMGYSASNTTELIRRIQCATPGYTINPETNLLTITRDTSANPVFTIIDAIKDANGNVTEVIDAKNVSTIYEFDSRDREIRRTTAYETDVEAITETDYDLASNVVEIRSPRYFDESDAQKAYMKTLFTYTGRGLQKTQRVAPGAGWNADATTSTSYTVSGRVATTTDPLSNVWTNDYDESCCQHYQGSIDPLGHGTMSNADCMGRVVHTAVVGDYAEHTDKHDPDDGETYAESTVRYDNLGRVVARTQWLEPLGSVNPESPPIAGLDSVDPEDGITTLTFYDNNIGDGVGLDSSGGMTIPKLGGGTYSLSLDDVLAQLAETEANGGANTEFTEDINAGSAVVTITPTEEIFVSVSDSLGRTVITAQLQGWNGPDPFELVTWNCMVYDQIEEIGGFGDVLETRSVNALGKVTKSGSDPGAPGWGGHWKHTTSESFNAKPKRRASAGVRFASRLIVMESSCIHFQLLHAT